jgi:hypothetical protein
MITKDFFSLENYKANEYLRNKLLSQNKYTKIYVRNQINSHTNIFILENNNSFDFYNQKENSAYEIGNSIASNPFLLKNQNDKTMQLKTFFTKTTKNIFLNEIYKAYKFILKKQNKTRKSLLLLKPIKGGFSCFSRGSTGFLPRRHGNRLLNKKIKSFFQNRNRTIKLSHIRYLLRIKEKEKRISDSNFLLRLPFFFAKLKIHPPYKKKVFSSSIKNKNIWGEANFVFLSKMKNKKLKQNKNEKIKNFIRRKKIKLFIKEQKHK